MNRRKIVAVVATLTGLLFVVDSAQPPEFVDRKVRQLNLDKVKQMKLKRPIVKGNVDPSLLQATGEQEVIVKLRSPPASDEGPEGRMSCAAKLKEEQTAFLERTNTTLNRISSVQTLLNAVFLKIDAKEMSTLAADPDVMSINRVSNYDMQVSETVPYIGATTVQNQGYDGTGVKVAVLDSGIDYTHARFGGGGTVGAFNAAYFDNVNRDGLFPTSKVVGGYDFVGEEWPGGPIAPDDDPIDGEGHGTAVADIINSVAPGISLYAIRVCGRLSLSCNGMAMLQGLEWAFDNGMDVVNLSIGTPYGQPFDNDLSEAINAASKLGMLVVAASGNAGDRPYVTATGGAAQYALSVAQTQVPSASLQLLQVSGVDYRAVFQPWSEPLGSTIIRAPVQYGDGQGGNLDGCSDFASGSLAGNVVLVDRGSCNFTLKITKITLGGGLVGIIGLISPEDDPFPGGNGGDLPLGVPGFMVSQADADAIKAAGENVIATLDPSNTRSLALSMAPSSSRGPQHEDTTLIKPEIGAPGASVAAIAGSGTGTAPFGGTSGAAPMIAGSAALVLDKYPALRPHEVKARLMNTCETNIKTDPFNGLAPITRVGGGEVRVDRALAARAAAWDVNTQQAALSFGFVDVFEQSPITLNKRLMIRNYSNELLTFNVSVVFRFPEKDTGAVVVNHFPIHQVLPGVDTTIPISLKIKGDLLSGNYMSSGEEGGSGEALTKSEYDGFLILDDGVQPLQIPWHVLPRKAANASLDTTVLDFSTENPTSVGVVNNGVGIAQIDSFSLIAVSENIEEGGAGQGKPTPDLRAVGISTLEVDAEVCSDTKSFVWAFAISTWERQQHLNPVALKIFVDIDQDGTDDFLIQNVDLTGDPAAPDGRQIIYVLNINKDFGESTTGSFVEHSMNTGNTVMYVCAEQIGLDASDILSTNVNIEVYTQDNLTGGPGDEVLQLTITPGGERFVASTQDLASGESGTITVSDRGAFAGNSEELGVMLITNGDRGPGNRGGATKESELLLLQV